MKNETAIAAIRQVYKGEFQITQKVSANDEIAHVVTLIVNSYPIAIGEGENLAEAVESAVQTIIGMIPVPQTVKEAHNIMTEVQEMIAMDKYFEENKDKNECESKEEFLARIIDIKDCTP